MSSGSSSSGSGRLTLTQREFRSYQRSVEAERQWRLKRTPEEIEKEESKEKEERSQRKEEKRRKREERRTRPATTGTNDNEANDRNDQNTAEKQANSEWTAMDEEKSPSGVGADENNLAAAENDEMVADGVDSVSLSSSKEKQETAPALAALSVLNSDSNAIDEALEEDRLSVNRSKSAALYSASASSSSSGSVHQPSWMSRAQLIDRTKKVPISSFALHPMLLTRLSAHGITDFFSTQSTVIPYILKSHSFNDICVCAPTGSGKTLSYVLPIIQLIHSSVVKRLRVLVVVPTRDLAVQVKKVFDWFCDDFHLKCECAIGQSSFASEQSKFLSADGSEWKIDILVCTPGRLLDHLASTPGFTLQYLQFLVIDEVDRLLSQHYQDWMDKISRNIFQSEEERKRNGTHCTGVDYTGNKYGWLKINESQVRTPFPRRDEIQSPFQKLLFSATLTTNPAKLTALRLRHPLFFSEASQQYHKNYQIPKSLEQRVIHCERGNKPLMLICLLKKILFQLAHNNDKVDKQRQEIEAGKTEDKMRYAKQVVIFTSSLQSTHRLARVLELFCLDNRLPSSHSLSSSSFSRLVCEYSSAFTQASRSSVLAHFASGSVRVLICSDVIARGIDLPSVDAVINYDVPVYIKTYVHRVGRTARAGKQGFAYTLCRKEELSHFYSILKTAENSFAPAILLDQSDFDDYLGRFEQCLSALKQVISEEKSNILNANLPLPTNRIPALEKETGKKKDNEKKKHVRTEVEKLIEREDHESNKDESTPAENDANEEKENEMTDRKKRKATQESTVGLQDARKKAKAKADFPATMEEVHVEQKAAKKKRNTSIDSQIETV